MTIVSIVVSCYKLDNAYDAIFDDKEKGCKCAALNIFKFIFNGAI